MRVLLLSDIHANIDALETVLAEAEPGSWYDPVLLGELSKTATKVSVEEGDSKTVSLKFGTTGQ